MALQALQRAIMKCHLRDDSIPASTAAALWEHIKMVLQSRGRCLNLWCEQELPLNKGNGRYLSVREGPNLEGGSSVATGHEMVPQEKDRWAGVAQIMPAPWLALWTCRRLGCPATWSDTVPSSRTRLTLLVQPVRSCPWTVPAPKLPSGSV